MKIIKIVLLFLGIIVLVSCSKDSEPVTSNTTTGYQQYGTPFANIPATKDVIMYEVNIRAFGHSSNLAAVTARMDSIKALSVNVIWLMPIFPIGQKNSVNSPYCIKNYKEVNPEFGTLQDLRTLVDVAHSKNIAVVLDWVANHTSWDNTWISNKAWYTQDGSGNIVSPAGTNWADVADLNYDNQEMRLAMIDAMKYWMYEANVDGFRCDAADYVPFSFWKQAIDSLKNIPNRKVIMLAEGSRTDHFTAGFQMNYAWDFYEALKGVFVGSTLSSLFNTHLIEINNVSNNGQKLRFTTNHDESAWDATPMVLFNGKKGALAASVAAIYLGGVPLIYSSQEVGYYNKLPFFSNTTIDWSANNDMFTAYKKLLAFYSSNEVLKTGTLKTYYDTDILIFKRYTSTNNVVVFINTKNSNQSYTLPEELKGSNYTNAMTGQNYALASSIYLGAYEYLIVYR